MKNVLSKFWKFIVTGTRAYGPARDDSDLDIVMIKEDSMSLLKWLSDHKISAYRHNEEEMYPFGGFYFNLGNIKINIINAYDESDLLFWERRTDALKKIAPILDRGLRIRAFHTSILEEES